MKKHNVQKKASMPMRFPVVFTLVFTVIVSLAYIYQKINYHTLLLTLKDNRRVLKELKVRNRSLAAEASVLHSSKRISGLVKKKMRLTHFKEDDVIYLKVEEPRAYARNDASPSVQKNRGIITALFDSIFSAEIAKANARDAHVKTP